MFYSLFTLRLWWLSNTDQAFSNCANGIKMSHYGRLTVPKLKIELMQRDALVSGRKKDSFERGIG